MRERIDGWRLGRAWGPAGAGPHGAGAADPELL